MCVDVLSLDPVAFADSVPGIGKDASHLALAPLDASLLRPDHPFLGFGTWRAFVTTRRDRPVARLVASIDPRQHVSGRAVGAVGFIAGQDAEALILTIEAAVRWLAGAGAVVVRCPVQLATWFGHRAVVDGLPEDGGSAPFVMEPRNGPGLAEAIRAAGFAEAHRAVSYEVDHGRAIAGSERGLARLRRAGFRDRSLDLARPEEDLHRLHRLSAAIFAEAWGYSDVSFEEFMALYGPLVAMVDPQLVRIVESEAGEAVGFVFAMLDQAGPGRGLLDRTTWERRIVVKTIGVLPAVRRECAGVGSALVALVHERARALGSAGGVHALMAEGSSAHRASAKWGTQFRTYATFERVVGDGVATERSGSRRGRW